MTPPQLHNSLESLVRAGTPPINTAGFPAIHGAVVTGTHGIGVKTPSAAAVAAATMGFAGLLHMPKGIIFTIGIWLVMPATGIGPITLAMAAAWKTDGAMPKEH